MTEAIFRWSGRLDTNASNSGPYLISIAVFGGASKAALNDTASHRASLPKDASHERGSTGVPG